MTGDLNSTDVDNPGRRAGEFRWSTTAALPPWIYGTYAIDEATGVWTYTLDDNSHPAVQALNVGDTLTDTFSTP